MPEIAAVRELPGSRGVKDLLCRAAPALVALATFAVFLPSLRGGILSLDDAGSLVYNQGYRGLGWPQLKWMFTTGRLGPYTPLTWLSHALDYKLWGVNPFGYHLTGVLLHSVNSALFFLLCLRLFKGPEAGGGERFRRAMAAGFAALFFSLHPMRVESVSWLSGRHDVLATMFALACVRAYIGYADSPAGALRKGWCYAAALLSFLFSLLSKSVSMTLPLVFVLLDAFPLKRLPADPRRWPFAGSRGLWLEKVPFLLLSLIFACAALFFQARADNIVPFLGASSVNRAAQVICALAFYPLKIALPRGLTPFYMLPEGLGLYDLRVALSALFLASASAAAYFARRPLPAAAAAWVYYLLTILPVSGVVRVNGQLGTDRYTYFSGLGFAALLGAGLLWCLRRQRPAQRAAALALTLAILGALGALCRGQQGVWNSSETVWRHVISINPNLAFARGNLGLALMNAGDYSGAEETFREMLRLRPNTGGANLALAKVMLAQGKPGEAAAYCRAELKVSTGSALAYDTLGAISARRGDFRDAVKQYRLSLRLAPGKAETHNELGMALSALGRYREAAGEHREAVKLKPDSHEAEYNLAYCLQAQRDLPGAEAAYRAALKLKPGYAPARNNLAAVISAQGRLEEAASEYLAVIKEAPGMAEAHYGLGTVRQKQGRFAEAAKCYRSALKLAPGYAEAHYNLAFTLYSLGEKEAALERMRQALRLNPALDPRLRLPG